MDLEPLEREHERAGGSVVKVYVYPADVHGCGFLRLIWPARALAAVGHDVVIVMPNGGGMDAFGRKIPGGNGLQGQIDPKTGRTVAATAPKDADVMVMQRITHRALAQAIPLWQSQGIAIVIDMDDDLSAIHPTNPAWSALHPTGGKAGFGWDVAHEACDAADLVTVSTPALLSRYARHGRGVVLENCIPERYLEIGATHADSDVVGWGGSVASHPLDLHEVGSAVADVVADGGWFSVVGPPDGIPEALRLPAGGPGWSATGGVPLMEWPRALAAAIGISIAPLADTRFNAAKSWLKPLEYAALGIPAVSSDRVEYARLASRGAGLVVGRPREWSRALRRLRGSRDYRIDLAGRGRQAAGSLTIEGRAWMWWEAWGIAMKSRSTGTRQSARIAG